MTEYLVDVTVADKFTVRKDNTGLLYIRRPGGPWVRQRVGHWLVHALAQEVAALRKEVYLPIPCYICGRNRLLYMDNEVRCEKCGADTEAINHILDERQAPPAYVMPKPPNKTCYACHAKMDVPHAKFLHLVGFWHFEWDCAKRCDPGLGIVFFPPQHYAKGVTKEELEQAGFVIVEQGENA